MKGISLVHGSFKTGLAICLIIMLATVLDSSAYSASLETASPSVTYRDRRSLGIQINLYPRTVKDGQDIWSASGVPWRYAKDFRNVCLYVEWADYQKYGPGKYRQIIDDVKRAQVDTISVCFCKSLPDDVMRAVWGRFNSWKGWLTSWANARFEIDSPEKINESNPLLTRNWWSFAVFGHNDQGYYQKYPQQSRDAPDCTSCWFYRTAVNLALPEYRQMVTEFATEFKNDVDYWQPWDEVGLGLNMAPNGVDVFQNGGKAWQPQVGQMVNFSGWPSWTNFADGTVVLDDYRQVQQTFYEALNDAYRDSGRTPYILTSSIIGSDSLVVKPPREFNGGPGSKAEQADCTEQYKKYINDGFNCSDDVSLKVTSDQNVVCERPMYFNYMDRWSGGDCTTGASAPATRWYFAEGTTRSNFDEYITVENSGTETANLAFYYMVEGEGEKITTEQVGPNRRATFTPRKHLGEGKDVSLFLESDQPVVVERPMYYSYEGKWDGGDCVVGLNEPSTTFLFAEGTTRNGYDEYFCLQNPNDRPINVQVRYLLGPGQGDPISKTYSVPGKQRLTINVNNDVGPEKDVAAALSSDIGFVAERPMYFDSHGCKGGHIAVGATTPSLEWFFAEGNTLSSFDEYICLLNPSDTPATVNAQFLIAGSTPSTTNVSIAPHSRQTLDVKRYVNGIHDVSAHITSDVPIVAERPQYFNLVRSGARTSVYNGGSVSMGSTTTTNCTYFAEGHLSPNMEEYLTVMNPSAFLANIKVDMYFGSGDHVAKAFQVSPQTRKTYSISANGMGLFRYCDVVGIHLFDLSSKWPSIYSDLRLHMDQHGLFCTELAVTSCGLPFGDLARMDASCSYNPVQTADHSYAKQAEAVGDAGVGALFRSGCQKVWVYRDIDEWRPCDQYFGLFSYVTNSPFHEQSISANDSWWEYVRQQNNLPRY